MSVKKFALALTLGLSLVSLNAHADYSQDYEKCMEATSGVTSDMLSCMTLAPRCFAKCVLQATHERS